MTATHFTDDAFNKRTCKGSGTLIGNWNEEFIMREATGEGRTFPQRHIPRSGLLKDWTKVPETGPRKQDDTFERCYGHRHYEVDIPTSKLIGAGDEEHVVRKPVAETLQAQGRVPRVGPRELAARREMVDAAEEAVAFEDEAEAEKANAREFVATTALHFAKPDETKVERPVHLRQSFRAELMYGPPADRARALGNAGLEHQTSDHYANAEAVTHARMTLADPEFSSGVKASATGGISCFGKHSEFSKPMAEFDKGQSKDETIQNMFEDLKSTQPLRTLGGAMPHSSAFGDVPSLAVLKEAIKEALRDTWGPMGFVTLRQRLHDASDNEGFVRKEVVVDVLRSDLGLSDGSVSAEALSVYLDQLMTMKKSELRASALLASLRPSLSLQSKGRALKAFASLGPVHGSVQLGDWLSRVRDDDLRRTLVTAFGGDGETSVADLPVAEPMFLEVCTDIAALAGLDSLL